MHTTSSNHSTRRGRRVRQVVTAVLVPLAVLGAACTSDRDPFARVALPAADWIASLAPAQGCEGLVEAATPVLRATVDARWPEPNDPGWFAGGDDAAMQESGAVAADGPGARSAASTVAPPPEAADGGADIDTGSASSAPSVVIGTNNQEVAVEESDLVKTDGRRLVSVVNGVLRVVELDRTPTIDGSLDLQARGASELFLRGDTALVLGTTYGPYGVGPYDPVPRPGAIAMEDAATAEPVPTAPPTTAPPTTAPPATPPPTTAPPTTPPPTSTPVATSTTVPATTTTVPATTVPSTTVPSTTVPVVPPPFPMAATLTLVSLAGGSGPTVLASADVEGSLVSARDHAGRARIVVQGAPAATERLSMSTDRAGALAAVDELTAQDLLPRVATPAGVRSLGDCDDVLVTERPTATSAGSGTTGGASIDSSGWASDPSLGTVTVLTVGDTLSDLAPVSVQGTAGTVYASDRSLYVAGSSWDRAGSRTDVHRFSLDGDGPAAYVGSGRAPGHLFDQFAMSERDGALRLVTTLDGVGTAVPIEPGIGGAAVDMAPPSSARLTVLDTEGTLDEIGHLDGMGIGEQVQSVRFMDDLAYVVTFRQVDPLYALDLSDPTAPRLLGELKIPGFSEYLHPVGDGLLLGVGRQVDPDTGIDEGLKISLFDVSDPVALRELDQLVLPGAHSEVSADHRAFLWDPARRHAVVPVESSGCDSFGQCDSTPGGAALVVRADRSGLAEVGRFSHEPMPGWSLQPNRTVLVDDDLWSVSIAAIGRTEADAPGSVELVRF